MSRAIAAPFRTISPARVVLSGWQKASAGGEYELVEKYLPGWDYDAPLRLFQTVGGNVPEMLEDTGLAGLAPELRLCVTARTGSPSFRWTVFEEVVPCDKAWEAAVYLDIPSTRLSGKLTMTTGILLGRVQPHDEPFVASLPASRLFTNEKEIYLEGELGRFPMEMTKFSKSLRYLSASNAMWFLDWDPSRPEAHFLGNVLLYINSEHLDAAARIQQADEAALSILRVDVIRTMCATLLANREFRGGINDFEGNTVGGQVREWLQLAFGQQDPEVIHRMAQHSPGRFEARLQSAFV